MGIDYKYLAKCAGKVQHKSYLGAQYALDNNPNATKADIYKCTYCGEFHIGTRSGNKNIKLKKNKRKEKENGYKREKRKVRKFRY